MPYAMCNLCGTLTHLSVGDVHDWYETNHPDLETGDIVPHPCYFCGVDLSTGMTVVVRTAERFNGDIKKGDEGSIKRVITSNGFSLFEVTMANGKSYFFVRSEIRKAVQATARCVVSKNEMAERSA